jgi:hypothetical protein
VADYDAYLIRDFVSGKKTRRGKPLQSAEAPEPKTVVAIPPSRARCFFRARDERELREHLGRLRRRGLLRTSKGRGLRQRIRTDAGLEDWYVVEAPWPEAVPRFRP